MIKTRAATTFFTCLVLMAVSCVSAHDLKGYLRQGRATSAVRDAISLKQSGRISAFKPLSVIVTASLWPVDHRLSICFVEGSPELRRRITIAMQSQWPIRTLTQGRLDYDSVTFGNRPTCGDHPSEDIRVAFHPGNGNWSFIGTESREYVPSMNFDGFTSTAPNDHDFNWIVGHELGHALGLHHEHQSPNAPNCNWDFDKIWTNYHWNSKEEMHENLDRLRNAMSPNKVWYYEASRYDKTSLMHYSFDPDMFTDGSHDDCYVEKQAESPSLQDKKAIATAYSPDLQHFQLTAMQLTPSILSSLGNTSYLRLKRLLLLKDALLRQSHATH